MKKVLFTLLVGSASISAIAAPVGSTFTGFGAGIDLTSVKYQGTKQATGIGILVDYGFDYGNNLVGLVEAKVKLNKSDLVKVKSPTEEVKVEEKWRASISYLQGYRVLPDLLPYVKVGYNVTQISGKFKTQEAGFYSQESISETGNSLVIGVGAKYAVSSNFELGAEYLRGRTKFKDGRINSNAFGANATYRF